MNTIQKIITVFSLFLAISSVSAQNGRNIKNIFDDYGKQKGSVLIELGKDVLGKHTKIDRYKSLILPTDQAIADSTLNAITKDANQGRLLFESKKDGRVEAAYYCLKKEEDTKYYEYILFTNKSKKITVIYLKGRFSPSYLEDELNKLKDLFIKVNNKHIKL